MQEVARGLIVLHPRQALVDWLNSSSTDDKPPLTLDDVSADAEGFLVPEFESDEEAMVYVRLHATELLEHVIGDWTAEGSNSPARLDYALLSQWFEVRFHSMVWDMVDPGEKGSGLN